MIKNCDFSLEHYFDVLSSLKNFKLGSVGDFPKLKNFKKFAILRHDVDFSLEYALKMAKKESEYGIKSTYFILIHGEFYNPFERGNLQKIIQISNLGHEIGLHYDTSFFPKSTKKESELINKEIGLLEVFLSKKIKSLSQHIPSETRNILIDLKKQGFIDSRNDEWLKKIKYISDSGRFWREGCFCENFKKFDQLQILTHPIWWVNDSAKRDDILHEFKNNEINNVNSRLNNYKMMVERLLEKLKAPRNEF